MRLFPGGLRPEGAAGAAAAAVRAAVESPASVAGTRSAARRSPLPRRACHERKEMTPTLPDSDGFSYRDGHLHGEDLDLETLAERFGTPLYVYSRRAIERAYDR